MSARYVVLMALALFSVFGMLSAAPAERVDSASALPRTDTAIAEAARLRQVRKDLESILLVDSVAWIKTTATRRPEETLDELARMRERKKRASLERFCNRTRLTKAGDVDSLKRLTPDERTFCKDRIRPDTTLIR